MKAIKTDIGAVIKAKMQIQKILSHPAFYNNPQSKVDMRFQSFSDNAWDNISDDEIKIIEEENKEFGSYRDIVSELTRLGLLTSTDIINTPHAVHVVWNKVMKRRTVKFSENPFVPETFMGDKEIFITEITNLVPDYIMQLNAFFDNEELTFNIDKYFEIQANGQRVAIIYYHNNEVRPICIDIPQMKNARNFTSLFAQNLSKLLRIGTLKPINWA